MAWLQATETRCGIPGGRELPGLVLDLDAKLITCHSEKNQAAPTMPDDALAQILETHRHGTDILIRTDSAGSPKAFLAHVRDMRIRGILTFFSVGYASPNQSAARSGPAPEQV
ncbi:hypothetical protein PV664_36315 [Streptomyces sp. ME01-18a]|uniref:hypothetical protein n=1 Tax=Streptomyces sp. ME01-18a TaxID=3028669 RepID=UPI0029B6E45D|nr:hypothetical protein [Streptomyces sp. ME01-18a]MDX3434309.1 hypothetical protein [Streptomyces sp. ME01-18a]